MKKLELGDVPMTYYGEDEISLGDTAFGTLVLLHDYPECHILFCPILNDEEDDE